MDIPLFNSEVKKLRKNNKELTAELTDIEKQYKDVYKVAEDWLRHIYMTCQRQFVLWRYWNLKDMIKECIEFLEHPETYRSAIIPEYITETSEKRFDYKDIEKLKTKEEVETDIELKLERKKELEKRIRRLKELGMKYQISKQHYPHRRYEELKSIIKEITRD
ncbi:uncharacterized protein LOC123551070 isoform X3 [Mercenaria mercenaria]|uniref:uncharacterized protein LOC123551070 isoform X2 n=1 Tax=Mercenaria mercenaria TaxID=6596 RepID=UPI00234F4906|nr:uncharacterized protein LOC123551070 isoform X2 [Mercenaria mercenaria]XP_045195668.2 uncharacterized protein LOC123551070 isoform X3 [Mercenaria mercenaria]